MRSRRAYAAMAAGVVLVGLITAALVPFRARLTRVTPALLLVLPVVAAGTIGGRGPATLAALLGAVAFSVAFIPPVGSVRVEFPEDVLALGVFVLVAVTLGTLFAREAARRRAAEAATAEISAMHERLLAVTAERERMAADANRVAVHEQADRQRAALLRSVSQDLRTPLSTILAVT